MLGTEVMFKGGLSSRWGLMGMLVLGSLLLGLGRTMLEPAVQALHRLAFADSAALDIVFAAQSVGLWMALILGAAASDRIGGARIAAAGMALGACGSLLTAFASSALGLAAYRLTFGAGNGLYLAGASLAIMGRITRQHRMSCLGVVHGAYFLGGVGPLVVTDSMLSAWRLASVMVAFAAFAWVVPWILSAIRAGRAIFIAHPDAPGLKRHLPRLLLPMFLAFAYSLGTRLYRDWLPAHQLDQWHLDLLRNGWLPGGLAAGTALGLVAGGFLGQAVLGTSGNLRPAHQLPPGLGFPAAAVLVLFLPHQTLLFPIAAVASGAGFCLGLGVASIWSTAIEVAAERPGLGVATVAAGFAFGTMVAKLMPVTGGGGLVFFLWSGLLFLAGIAAFNLCPDRRVTMPMEGVSAKDAEEEEKEEAELSGGEAAA